MPRLLRPLFRRRRELLGELSQAGAEAVAQAIRGGLGEDIRPGIVVFIATAGDLLQWHPHLHILSTDGGFSPDGSFRQMQAWDGAQVMRLFRERLLTRLVERQAISEELVKKLFAWRHPGFSAHLGEAIPFEQTPPLGRRGPRRRSRRSGARQVGRGSSSKVYQVDPLQRRKCGGPLEIVAYIIDGLSIRVDHEGREIGVTS